MTQYGVNVIIDAIVLAGGRSRRLGSVAKAELLYRQQSLVARTVDAAAAPARRTVVVGPIQSDSLSEEILLAREDPPFAGPPAAIGAGLDALSATSATSSDFTVVLACDMPRINAAVVALLAELSTVPDSDGVIAIDAAKHRQPLAAIYATPKLTAAITSQRALGTLDGLSMFALIGALDLHETLVPDHATEDIDTWADAARFGLARTDIAKEN